MNIKKILLKLTVMLFSSFGFLFSDCQVTVDVGVGYRRDDIKWNLETDERLCDQSFNASSKMHFNDVEIFVLKGKIRAIDTCYYFRGYADYGWILTGKYIDCTKVTQDGANSPLASIRIDHGIDQDYAVDAGAALGFPFNFGWNKFVIAPVVGYSYSAEVIEIKRRLHFNELLPLDGREADLYEPFSDYQEDPCDCGDKRKRPRIATDFVFRWYGPFVGFDAAVALPDCWSLYTEFAYHFSGEIKRRRKTALRERKIDDYDHIRCGYGFSYLLGTNYFFWNNWFAGFTTDFVWWTSNSSTKLEDNVRICSWSINGVLGLVF